MHWIWEATGNVGKSVLASYFVDCCGAIEVAGTCRDSLYAICAYVEANGRGPPMILFDLARRSHEFSRQVRNKKRLITLLKIPRVDYES